MQWIASVQELTQGEVIAVDGKQLRRSHDASAGKAAIHMVCAWAAHNGLVLGQRKVDKKSNEITAIPELLQKLEISGCIVTIDAMGCQTKIAETIVEKDADYAKIMALKTLPFFATLLSLSLNKTPCSKLTSRINVCEPDGNLITCFLSSVPSLLYNKYAVALRDCFSSLDDMPEYVLSLG